MTTTPAEPGLVLERRIGAVASLTLNRPKARNALSAAMMSALMAALERIKTDPAVKAVILSGEGPAFCAGHDLKELMAAREAPDGGRDTYARLFAQCADLMQAIIALPQPVIAAVHGIATAAGCQLVATCDLAVAARDARFATPGVNIGLFCSTPMVALSRNLSRKAAMEMLLTGEMADAETAQRLGLVNRVVAPDSVGAEALSLAHTIASKSSRIVASGKAAFYAQAEMPLNDAYAYTADIMTRNMMDPHAAEGIGAFLDKRDPSWD